MKGRGAKKTWSHAALIWIGFQQRDCGKLAMRGGDFGGGAASSGGASSAAQHHPDIVLHMLTFIHPIIQSSQMAATVQHVQLIPDPRPGPGRMKRLFHPSRRKF